MDDLSSQFMDTFVGIENWLRNQLDAPDTEDFVTLLQRMAHSNAAVKQHSSALKTLARLRNLLAHNYSRDQPLAVPTNQSVERIQKIYELLRSPPLLLSVAAKPVVTCRPTEPLGVSVKKMYDGVFSQLPIYEGNNCLGVLTAETVARWLATMLGGGIGLVEERLISDVVKYQEDPENHTFASRTSTVADGLAAFEKFQRQGKRLEAILITQSGRGTESPLGIVTIHDIPKLNHAIHK